MSITAAQIRGARGILNWSQQDLATRTGISATSIGAIESGQTAPRASTLETMETVFQRSGVEFVEPEGVRKRADNTRLYEGQNGFREFFDDVYETTRKLGGTICLFNGVPPKLIENLGEDWYQNHVKRMLGIEKNFTFKIIVEEGEQLLIAKDFAEYRWFPKEKFNQRTIYCYGDKIAFLDFSQSKVRTLVMKQAEIADSFRVLFDIAWNHVATLPKEEAVSGIEGEAS